MKISVVVPVRNEEKMLPRFLKSLKKQDFPKQDFEVIIVDNNSSDNTVNIAKDFGATVVYESRQGIPYARDTGTRRAKGEIIIGTDSDCLFPRNHLTKVYQHFTNNPHLVGLSGSVYMPDAPRVVSISVKILSAYGHISSRILKTATVCWAPNFSFRKQAFNKCGGYDLERPLLKLGLNSHVTDEYSMSDRLMATGGKVLFDKNIILQTSGRRFKNRLFYWFFVEHMLGLVLNEKLYNMFGIVIPINGYERVSPQRFYRYTMASVIASAFIFVTSYSLIAINYNGYLPQNAQTELRKLLTLQSDISNLSHKLNLTNTISPYLNRYVPNESVFLQ